MLLEMSQATRDVTCCATSLSSQYWHTWAWNFWFNMLHMEGGNYYLENLITQLFGEDSYI